MSVEQYFQFYKVVASGAHDTAGKITLVERPDIVKRLSRSLRPHKQWDQEAVMKAGLLAKLKFTQNPRLGEFLRNTGDTVLAESSAFDTYWETGLSLEDVVTPTPLINARGEGIIDWDHS